MVGGIYTSVASGIDSIAGRFPIVARAAAAIPLNCHGNIDGCFGINSRDGQPIKHD